MRFDEWGSSFGIRDCPHCGAGTENNNKHDEDCLINIPGSYRELSPSWHTGWGSMANPATAMPFLEAQAYLMGQRCRQKHPPRYSNVVEIYPPARRRLFANDPAGA